jgi:hypothetical protein
MQLRRKLCLALIFCFGLSDTVAMAQQTQTRSTQPEEVYIWGQQPTSAATEQTRWQKDLELRPSNTPSDVMRLTPGLIIGQHHGGGKADQMLFRGFDSDHGTDFAVFIDGIPVNMVSHAHGQGYADLHFLIPETIERVEIYKGPYFVQLGDFATSGAMNIITKKRDKDSTLTLGGGSYNTQRYVGVLSPPEGTMLAPTLPARSIIMTGLSRIQMITSGTTSWPNLACGQPQILISVFSVLFLKPAGTRQARSPRGQCVVARSVDLVLSIPAKEENQNAKI